VLRLSFGALDAASDGVAGVLSDAGVQKGDVVALLLPSSIDYAVCYHAAMRLGAVTSGVNPRLGRTERESIFERLQPTVTVVDVDQGGANPTIAIPGKPIFRAQISSEVAGASAGKSTHSPRLPKIDPTDPVAVVWTGGSTGIPKGALFDHLNMKAVAAGTDVLSAKGDRRLSPLPFAHVGYMTRAWDEISKLIATVITPTPWSAATAIQLIEQEAITVGQGVPTQWALVLAHPDLEKTDVSSLRIAGTGAARVPPELVRSMRERLGCPVVVRYTSTETSLGTGTRPGDPDEVVATTVGSPVAGVELQLVGLDRAEVPQGEVGTVRMRSVASMRGYVGRGTTIDSVATRAVVDQEGWITTGDLGFLGPDGNLRLVGRSTEMLIRGGYNIYPSEVEAALGEHPGVAHVAVVGAPDSVLGEVVVAFVVPNFGLPSPELGELREHCRARLADYKAPDRLVLVSDLPTTPIGKVDFRELKARAANTTSDVSR
jgi:acyl-CoA synthetase (AMP-forming)/AMP-acid ligase II